MPKGSIRSSAQAKSNLAEIGIELNLPSNYSGISTRNYANRWRELTGGIADAIELGFTSEAFGVGNAIEFELYGRTLMNCAVSLASCVAPYKATPGCWMSVTVFAPASRKYNSPCYLRRATWA